MLDYLNVLHGFVAFVILRLLVSKPCFSMLKERST
ncbi:hypothetical protein CsSME_00050787 [Camellia sinensis var. sinensis]